MLPSLLPAIGLFYVNIHLLDRVVVCSVWGGARCLTSCHAALGDRMRGGGAWPLRCPWHTGDTVLTTAGAGAGRSRSVLQEEFPLRFLPRLWEAADTPADLGEEV